MDINLFLITFLMILLTTSSLSKFFSLKSFNTTLNKIGFSKKLAGILSYFVPLAEITIVVLMVSPNTQQVAFLSVILLSLAFTSITVYTMKFRKVNINCNCFGSLTEERLGPRTFLHIILLVIPTVIILFNGENNKGILNFSKLEIGYTATIEIGLIMIYLLVISIRNYLKAIKRINL
ncbi:MauE/DoxX family redox-associated membrane protein [Peribacillus butanolivorans]|uniref:MauE/DoxX family redox-associated membrane protein n=1 Tax=Peribacillus butanolivorans TaxID=421767 RepID=UPI003D284B9F